MFGSSLGGANAYAKVGIETGVVAASPHKLIVMLFDGALASLATALHHMRAANIQGKGLAISKAVSIIDSGLRASLDQNAGGEIAQNLDSLYGYMSRRLLLANLENRPEIIEEVQRLLQDLRDAWQAIAPATERPSPAQEAPAAALSTLAQA